MAKNVTDEEVIAAMNLIKNHCKGRICVACACWNPNDKKCIVIGSNEPCSWETDKAVVMNT